MANQTGLILVFRGVGTQGGGGQGEVGILFASPSMLCPYYAK